MYKNRVHLIWVEASAGSGKTTFLVNEIKRMVSQIKPEQIMCLTFSNAAAQEMRNRLKECSELFKIQTIHSLSYDILSRIFPNKKITTDSFYEAAMVQTLEDPVCAELAQWLIEEQQEIEECVAGIPKPFEESYPIFEIPKMLEPLAFNNLIPLAQREKIKEIFYTKTGGLRKKVDIEVELKEWAIERINLHENYADEYAAWAKQTLFKAIIQKEEFLKRQCGAWYYSDLIKEATQILENDSDAVYENFGNIKVILIDESQDLSVAQWDFVLAILKEWHSTDGKMIVVGDSKQLVYEFQGANFEYFQKAKKKCFALANASGSAEEKKMQITYRLPQKIARFIENLGYFTSLNFGKHESFSKIEGKIEIPQIKDIKDVVSIIKTSKHNPGEIMILFKQRSQRMYELAREFFKQGIIVNSPIMQEHPIIKDFQHLINFLLNDDTLSLGIVFKAMGNDLVFLDEIKKNDHYADFEEMKNLLPDTEAIFLEWLPKTSPFLKYKLGVNFGFWVEILRLYGQFYQNDPFGAITNNNNFWEYLKENFEFDGIILDTIHSAKGKEANLVILCDSEFKSKFKNDTERLLYVALTRAKSELLIPITKQCENTWAELLERVAIIN